MAFKLITYGLLKGSNFWHFWAKVEKFWTSTWNWTKKKIPMLVCLTWIVRSYSVGGRRQVKAFFIFIFIFAMPYTSSLALPSLPPSVPFKHERRRSQKSFKRQTLGIRLFCHVAHVSWQFQSTVVGMASYSPCAPHHHATNWVHLFWIDND